VRSGIGIPTGTIYLYRTTNNGTVYYKCSGSAKYSPGLITITDIDSDATLISSELLYTTGGELENVCPPTPHVMSTFGNRLATASNELPGWIYLSKEINSGRLEFNEALSVYVPFIGVCKGLAEMDGVLYAFGKGSVAAIYGAGLNAAGYGAGWEAQLVTNHFGCDNRHAVVATPAGILAQDKGELYMLSRSRQRDTSITDPIRGLVAGTDIVSAVYDPNANVLQLVLTSGTVARFSFLTGRWSIIVGKNVTSQAVWDGGMLFSGGTGGNVLYQSSLFTDQGTVYSLDIQTGWIKLGELAQEAQMYWLDFLFEYKSPHTLVVDLFYDYETSSSESHQMVVSSDFLPYRVRIKPLRERCVALRARIRDTSATGTAEGFHLIGMSVELEASNSLGRLPDTRTVPLV